jgi:titin
MEKRVTVQKFHKVVELEDARPSETIYLRHFDRQALTGSTIENLPSNQRPPQFLTDFRDTHVQGGEKAEFVASLTPTIDPSLQLIWSHNGATLDVHGNRRFQAMFALGQVRLVIVDVRMEDAGVYICQAVNSAGEAATAGALSVTSRHEYSHSYRSELIDGAGQQLNQRRIVEEKTAQHTIERVQTPSLPIEPIRPPSAPKFVTRFERLRIEEGSNAHLHARLDCDQAQISWLFNGRPLLASERIGTHANDGLVALNMYCARLTDSGTYTCVAVNAYGSAQLHTEIEGQSFWFNTHIIIAFF